MLKSARLSLFKLGLPTNVTSFVSTLLVSASILTLVSMESADAQSPSTSAVDEFQVVDCLLPGQVRRLGNMTYLSRRRPVMTTAHTCAQRGGEYIFEDRASIDGSLNVWMPLAMDGDADAQNHVGELLVKGGANGPDYPMAKLWFERAAEQGRNDAMFNLAHLYENGHGVSVDQERADYWYRRAYGFDAEFAENVTLVDAREFEELQTTVASQAVTIEAQSEEIVRLRTEVSRLEQDISVSRIRLKQARRELGDYEKSLADARLKLAQSLSANRSPLVDTEEANARYQAAQLELAETQSKLEQTEAELQRKRQELADELQRATTDQSSVRDQALQVAVLTDELNAETQRVSALQIQLDEATQARSNAMQDLAELRAKVREQAESIAQREVAFAERERQMLQRTSQFDGEREQELEQELAILRDEAEAREALAIERSQLDLAREVLAVANSDYEERLMDIERREAEVINLSAEMSVREAAVLNKEEILRAQDAQLRTVSTTVLTQNRIEIQRLQTELNEERQAVARARDSLERQANEVKANEARLSRQRREVNARIEELDAREAELSLREAETRADQITTIQTLERLQELRSLIENASFSVGGVPRSATDTSLSLTPKIDQAMVNVDFGDFHALLIGNENYLDPNWPDLDTAHNDVRVIGGILEAKYGFQTEILMDATRYDIMEALSNIALRLNRNDNLLIYFAGHGQYIDQIGAGYWEPIDSVTYKTIQSVSVEDLNAQLSMTSARKVLVVSDSCYSGAFTRAPISQLNPGADNETRERYLQRMAERKSRNVMTAGGLQPVADGLGNGHSLFARAFITVLKSNDQITLGRDVFTEVRDFVALSAEALRWEQEPEYDEIGRTGHEGGDFIFVPRG